MESRVDGNGDIAVSSCSGGGFGGKQAISQIFIWEVGTWE